LIFEFGICLGFGYWDLEFKGTTMDLVAIWSGLIGLAIILYVVLDGFGLGIGLLSRSTRNEEERDILKIFYRLPFQELTHSNASKKAELVPCEPYKGRGNEQGNDDVR